MPTLLTPAEAARRRVLIRGVLTVIVLALIAYGVYSFLTTTWWQTVQSARSVPDSLKEMRFVTQTESGDMLAYRVTSWGFAPEEISEQKEIQQAFSSEINRTMVKKNPVVSPNKTSVGFAELVEDESRNPAWQISVMNVLTGSQRRLGEGFAGLFVDELTFARLAPSGIVVSNVETGEEDMVLEYSFPDPSIPVSVSPNGSLIAWPVPSEESIVIYTVTHNAATLVSRYSGPHDSFTLANDRLYVVRVGENATQIFEYPLAPDAREKLLHTLPSSLGVTAVMLPQ